MSLRTCVFVKIEKSRISKNKYTHINHLLRKKTEVTSR